MGALVIILAEASPFLRQDAGATRDELSMVLMCLAALGAIAVIGKQLFFRRPPIEAEFPTASGVGGLEGRGGAHRREGHEIPFTQSL